MTGRIEIPTANLEIWGFRLYTVSLIEQTVVRLGLLRQRTTTENISLRKYDRLYQNSNGISVMIYSVGYMSKLLLHNTAYLSKLSFNCSFNFSEVIHVRLRSFLL